MMTFHTQPYICMVNERRKGAVAGEGPPANSLHCAGVKKLAEKNWTTVNLCLSIFCTVPGDSQHVLCTVMHVPEPYLLSSAHVEYFCIVLTDIS